MALLQGHLDMVCEKNEGTVHDFDVDPIKVIRDGDWLMAEGTTLGSDNGVGVAAALAVMESKDIAHGPLEFVFTIDEETGLTGASEFPAGLLKSKYFLNLDNEDEGTLCIVCSGGVKTTARRKVGLHPAGAGSAWRIKVSGLKGGHSGVDIHQGNVGVFQQRESQDVTYQPGCKAQAAGAEERLLIADFVDGDLQHEVLDHHLLDIPFECPVRIHQ